MKPSTLGRRRLGREKKKETRQQKTKRGLFITRCRREEAREISGLVGCVREHTNKQKDTAPLINLCVREIKRRD